MDLLTRAKQLKEVSSTPTGVNLHGAGGLLSMPGLGKRRKKKKVTTKHLQGQHDQAVHGRFGSDAEMVDSLLKMPMQSRIAAMRAMSPEQRDAVTAEMGKRSGITSTPQKPKNITIRKEPEPHSKTGYAWRAYDSDGSPLYTGGETKNEVVDRLRKSFNVADITEKSITTKPGDKYSSIKNPKLYEKLRSQGYSKSSAAAISNAQVGEGKKKKEVSSSFTVFKQKNGRYRWFAISSNAYRDRDGEIVSTKALQNDCDRADREKDYGTLRFWHVPGVDIGDCDFNTVHSKSLLESGTFRDEKLAERISRKAGDYQLSIGFRHPPNEPGVQGVFHNIRRFERSLVPAGKAANPFTSLTVHKESNRMNEEKRKALLTLFDGDEEAVKALVSRATESEKQADSMGIAFKDKKLSFQTADELLAYAVELKEAEVKAKAEAEEDEEEFDFKGYMDKCVGEMKGYTTKMGDMMSRMEKMFGERDTKKEDTTAAIKEATDAHSQRLATLEATIKQTQEALATAVKELTDLKGNAPAGVTGGVRPTQSTDNIVTKKEAPENGFVNSLKGWAEFAVPAQP